MPSINSRPISSPVSTAQLIGKGGVPTLDMIVWMESISAAVNSAPPLAGTGSPEGIEVAKVGQWYVDKSAPIGAGIYLKESGTGGTGWIKRS